MTLHNTTAWKTIKKGNHHQNRYCIFQKLIFPFINTFPLKGQKWFLQADEHDATWDDDQQTFSGADIHVFVQYNAEGRDFWWQGVVAAHLCVCVYIYILGGRVPAVVMWHLRCAKAEQGCDMTETISAMRCSFAASPVPEQEHTHVTGGQSSR